MNSDPGFRVNPSSLIQVNIYRSTYLLVVLLTSEEIEIEIEIVVVVVVIIVVTLAGVCGVYSSIQL